MYEHLFLCIGRGLSFAKWLVDAIFAVHEDFRSHKGGLLLLSEKGASLIYSSRKQGSNKRSSTYFELIVVEGMLSKVVWCSQFGFTVYSTIVQDIKIAMRLETKGIQQDGQRSHHTDVHYYFCKDSVEKVKLTIEFIRTQDMVADVFARVNKILIGV